jgi:GT2 family glycosyltransferase
MTIPDAVLDAARRRAVARAARDWATADRLRGEIEAAGWRVIDRGTDFRLEPAHPPDLEAAGVIRHGRVASVPSRLDDAPSGPATIVATVSPLEAEGAGLADLERALDAILRAAPAGVDAVVVADGLSRALDEALDVVAARLHGAHRAGVEIVRTSAELGRAAALNIGIRRSSGSVVVALDPSIVANGDVVSPLLDALADESVAVAGPFGLATGDLRHFDELVATGRPLDATAISGYLMAFRRADAAARGPLDEGFRFYRNLDIWWSLVLRDEGEDRAPRRAIVVPGLELTRGEPRSWSATPEAERDRLSKRNFYRLLDRFRTRLDLAVPPPG